MTNITFTAIDFETANNSQNSICQVGIVRVENAEIVYRGSYLVQPPNNEYSHWNVCIHGISPDQTVDAPFFPEVWNSVKHFFDNQLIVAHNSDFDIPCLLTTLKHYNLAVPAFRSDCTYKLTGLSLVNMCESLEIPLGTHHHAMYDALGCAEAYIKLLRGCKPNHALITTKVKKSPFEGRERLKGEVLKPCLEKADINSPFYGKKIVFTGVLSSISREEAGRITQQMGADIDSGVTRKTDYVILGAGAGPAKLKKIEEYNRLGSMIKILKEKEFLELINK